MTSEKQIAANRRNSRRSTGPKTEAGKKKSSRNALKHGLLSTSFLLPSEDPKEFAEFAAAMRDELGPAGTFESFFVDQIISACWRLRRAALIEAGILSWEFLGFQSNRARRDAEKYVERSSPFESDDYFTTKITNKNAHEAALKAARRAKEERSAPNSMLGLAFMQACETGDSISQLLRYESAISRSLDRFVRALRDSQTAGDGTCVA